MVQQFLSSELYHSEILHLYYFLNSLIKSLPKSNFPLSQTFLLAFDKNV